MACAAFKITPARASITLTPGNTLPFRGVVRVKPDLNTYNLTGAAGVFNLYNADGTVLYTTTAITFNSSGQVQFDVPATTTATWSGDGAYYELIITLAAFGTRTFWYGAFNFFSIVPA